jgi:hypothetical protein
LIIRFGDKGCAELCRGLANNVSLLSLSLNYCNLTYKSGAILGEILNTTALKYHIDNLPHKKVFIKSFFFKTRDLYLDGNELRCQGVMELLKTVSEECENEALKKDADEREKLEEEYRRLSEGYFFQNYNI